jgi:hypothetical protein
MPDDPSSTPTRKIPILPEQPTLEIPDAAVAAMFAAIPPAARTDGSLSTPASDDPQELQRPSVPKPSSGTSRKSAPAANSTPSPGA